MSKIKEIITKILMRETEDKILENKEMVLV
jgi:hypothetical protein